MTLPDLAMATGHRPQHLPPVALPRIRRACAHFLRCVRDDAPDIAALSGMAIGTDLIYAEEALELGIPLWAAIPFPGQESRWRREDRDRYATVLKSAQAVHILFPDKPTNKHEAVQMLYARDAWMVDHARVALACWTGKTSGGTFHTVNLLRARGLPISRFDPLRNLFVDLDDPGEFLAMPDGI